MMAYNKRFTNRLTWSLLEIRIPHFHARASQARVVQKKMRLRISEHRPSNPVSKSLIQHVLEFDQTVLKSQFWYQK